MPLECALKNWTDINFNASRIWWNDLIVTTVIYILNVLNNIIYDMTDFEEVPVFKRNAIIIFTHNIFLKWCTLFLEATQLKE